MVHSYSQTLNQALTLLLIQQQATNPFDEYLGDVKVEANKTTYLNTFLEAEGWVPPAIVYENYPDALAGNKAYGVGSQYNLNASAEVTIFSNELKDKTVRRQLVRDGRIYILALDAQNEPFIYMGNIADNSVKQISTAGLELKRKPHIEDC